MRPRLELQKLLEDILGSRAVYHQPPDGLTMEYPCIVYQRDYAKGQYADNIAYLHTKRYQVTFIGPDPDSDIPDKIAQLPLTRFANHFASDDLNHDVYDVYF